MKEAIRKALEEPELLEALYRSNKRAFKEAVEALCQENPDQLVLKTWHVRLKSESEGIAWGSKADWIFLGVAILISGTLAKLPDFFQLDPNNFFSRYISFIHVPFLFSYFAWKNKLAFNKYLITGLVWILGLIYMTILPGTLDQSDTFFLAATHFLLFMWTLVGVAFSVDDSNKPKGYSRFLQFNGEFLILSVIVGLSGALFLVINVNLFDLIGVDIRTYINRYGVYGLSAIPILACHLLYFNPTLMSRISPLVARLFSPAAMITLVIYLTTSLLTSADPYNDRGYLVMLNGVIIAVMALILFSVSDVQSQQTNRQAQWVLLLLAGISIIIDITALSAILYRIAEWGITPNRMAVLGSNLLMLVHLTIVLIKMITSLKNEGSYQEISATMGSFLPLYSCWFVIVTILFPILFSFK